MKTLLKEFSSSHDIKEAVRCINELATPYYHHELIKQVTGRWLHRCSPRLSLMPWL